MLVIGFYDSFWGRAENVTAQLGKHSRQMKQSEKYSVLRPTISVCIVDFLLFPGFDDYHMEFHLRNKLHDCVFSGDIEVVTLEVPQFAIPEEKIKTPLEQWMHFLRFGDKLDIETVLQKNP